VAELTGADLGRYRAAVRASAAHAPGSQALALAALRSFLRWAGTMGAHSLPESMVRAQLKTPTGRVQRPYVVLTELEVAALLGAADTDRDRALLAVLMGAGLRVGEAVGLDVSDLIEDASGGAALYVRQGKGRKDRTVPIQPEVTATLRRYLAATGRTMGAPGPMFRAHDRAARKLPRDRLTARAVGFVVARCTERAGIDAKRVTPHSLRHTYAMRALTAGAQLLAVSKLLGHASVTTTQRYVDHLSLRELRDAVPHLPTAAA